MRAVEFPSSKSRLPNVGHWPKHISKQKVVSLVIGHRGCRFFRFLFGGVDTIDELSLKRCGSNRHKVAKVGKCIFE